MLKEIVRSYFESHPAARDDVMKAYHAYHAPENRFDRTLHSFTNQQRQAPCIWCGRTRERVRWDDLPARCLAHPEYPGTADCIQGEEKKYAALLERAKTEVPRIVARLGYSEATLKFLHDTHGFDWETVEACP